MQGSNWTYLKNTWIVSTLTKKNRFTYLCIHMYPDDDVRIYKHNYVERDRGQIGKLAWQEWTGKKKLTQQHDSWVDLLFLLLSSPSVLFHISALYVYISSCPLRLFSVWLLHSTLGKKVFCLHLRLLSY